MFFLDIFEENWYSIINYYNSQKEVETMTIYDSELKVLEVLWENGPMIASEIAKLLSIKIGWNRNTTYTVIKNTVKKGLVERSEPKFLCTAKISLENARKNTIDEIKEKYFDNSSFELIQCMLSSKELSNEEIEELYSIIKNEMRTNNL